MKKNSNSNYDYDYSSTYITKAQNYSGTSYKKRSRNLHIPFCLLMVIIIVLMGVGFYLLQNRKEIDFYFVQVGEFTSYVDASKLSTELQKKGGAGYVYFDDRYHVLASFYPNLDDAKQVCENIKNDYANAQVFTLTTYQFRQNSRFSAEENKAIASQIDKQKHNFNDLYKNILDFDKSEINEKQLSIKIENLHSDFKKEYEDFKRHSQNNKTLNFCNKYLQSILDSLLASVDYAKDSSVAELKYELIKIVVNHTSFLGCFE